MNSSIAQYSSGGWLTERGDPGLSADDQCALARAVNDLERQSWATRLTAILRQRVGVIGVVVPPQFAEIVNKTAEGAIKAAYVVALRSLDGKPVRDRRGFHKRMAALVGGAGGAFGLSGLPIELPLTTMIMLRSIADIARGEGEDLADRTTALSCLAVLGLGSSGSITVDQAAKLHDETILETGYFATRAVLARSVTTAGQYFLGQGVGIETAPVMARYVSQIATRFGIAASQKLTAQAIPLIGAAAGATINYAFMDHFQTIARGHFTILRLERRYGAALVRAEYERLSSPA